MKCDLPRELLSGYLDDELDKKQQSEIEEHLKECQRCREELEELRQMDRYVKTLEIEEPSREFIFNLNRRVIERVGKKSRFKFFPLSPILVPVAVAALVFIVLINIHQPERIVNLNDRILYAEMETKEDFDVQMPSLSVVRQVPKEEKDIQKEAGRTAAPQTPSAGVFGIGKKADITDTRDEEVSSVALEEAFAEIRLPEDKIVRAIVDSTGTVVKVATGNTLIPEKDTMLENCLQGQQLRAPMLKGKRAQLYVDFIQRKEEKN